MSRLENILVRGSTAVSTLTGVVYLVMKCFMENDDPFSVLGHPWQPYMLEAHLLIGPVVVFALGLIAREHILGRAKNGNGQHGIRTGVSTILVAAPMVFSGYLLQVITSPAIRLAGVVVHLASGALFAALLLLHIRGGAVRARAARARAATEAPARLD